MLAHVTPKVLESPSLVKKFWSETSCQSAVAMEFVALRFFCTFAFPFLSFVVCFWVFAFFAVYLTFFFLGGNLVLCRNAVYFVVGLIDGIWRHAGKISAFVIYK